jgi:hypothetical protein
MRQGDFQLSPATGAAAVMAWRRVLQARIVQLGHRTNLWAAWRQPSRAPRQSPPAVTATAAPFSDTAALHRPLGPPQPVQLRHQRPGAVLQIPQIAVAVERPPVDATGLAAPVAGLRGARTGVVGRRPAAACAALVEPRAGRDGDLPEPARRPAPHEASPPLAWLPGSDQPTEPAGTARPEPHRGSTVLSAARACRARSGPAGDPKTRRPAASSATPCPDIRSASGCPYACVLTRQVWGRLTRRSRPLLEQAATWRGTPQPDSPEPRGPRRQPWPPWWCRAPQPRSSP